MTSLQHHAASSETRLSCTRAPPGSVNSTSGEVRGAGASTTTPHRMNSREATWVAARGAVVGKWARSGGQERACACAVQACAHAGSHRQHRLPGTVCGSLSA